MKHRELTWMTAGTLAASFAVVAIGTPLAAQDHPAKHKHYTLVDVGTLGGPNTYVIGINSQGTAVGGSTTSVPDPICTGPWDGSCYYEHAFKWREGVLTDLGTLPGGNNSIAASINSQGAVLGASENGLPDPVYGVRAFVATIWKHGEVQDLGTLGGGLSWTGLSINDRGQAVGAAMNTNPDPDGFGLAIVFEGNIIPGNQWHAVLWQNGTIQDLGTLGEGLDSDAFFVNQQGQVAGISYTDSIVHPENGRGTPTQAPFFWENGQMTNVGTLGGAFGVANGLNNRGQVVGSSNVTMDGSLDHAFLWDRGSLHDLGTFGGDFSNAFWIDDSGEVVGGATTPGNLTLRAARWKNGHITNLGSLNGDVCSYASSSNSKGQIIGNSIPCDTDGPSLPFLWENGGPMVDLNTLIPPGSGVVLNEGVSINEKGEIVASATLDNGDVHSFPLIPKEGDDREGENESPTQSDAAPAVQSPSSVTHGRLTPETLAALRAQLAHRYRGLGSRPPRRGN
jgi:probable HAF family extracellular repeat protein